MRVVYVPSYVSGPNDSAPCKHIANFSDVTCTIEQIRSHSFDEPTLYLGGDQGITLWTINNAIKAHGSDIFVFYLDSHADINTPDTSYTKNRHGMVMNPSFRRDCGAYYIPLRNVIYYGLKDLDAYEMHYLLNVQTETHSILRMPLTVPEGARVHLAIDMDCMKLDAGVSYPFNSGFAVNDVLEFIDKVSKRYNIISAELVEYIPRLDTKNKKVLKNVFMPLAEKLKRL